MSGKGYLKDQLPVILVHLLGMLAISVFLMACGNPVSVVLFICMIWLAVVVCCLAGFYVRRKRHLDRLLAMTEQLEERYLIPEVMPVPERADEQVFYRIMKLAEKSMLEKIGEVRRERKEYKEYIEQWIHEVKTPITAIRLLCENYRQEGAAVDASCCAGGCCEEHCPESGAAHGNARHSMDMANDCMGGLAQDAACNRGECSMAGREGVCGYGGGVAFGYMRYILAELENVNRFTEQALYYARSEHAEKDYSIREVKLADVVHETIAENKYLLRQSDMAVVVDDMDCRVYADDKWIRFILNQIVSNAVKYRGEEPWLRFSAAGESNWVTLWVEDNGVGIPECDLGRVFEKGFTGQNGRAIHSSTGIGLYLCKRLCDKLGIGLAVFSQGRGTRVALSFSINDFVAGVQG